MISNRTNNATNQADPMTYEARSALREFDPFALEDDYVEYDDIYEYVSVTECGDSPRLGMEAEDVIWDLRDGGETIIEVPDTDRVVLRIY